jgi:hypothetical protein
MAQPPDAGQKLRRQIQRVSGIPFRVEVIRRFAMALAASREYASVQTQNYPSLEEKHLDHPRMFSDRTRLISSMRSVRGGVIAEVGVAEGEFSEYLLNELRPRKFVAIDIFTMHEVPRFGHLWFDNMTHLDYYKRRFADRGGQVIIENGMGHVTLAKYPDKSFDLIYIDADHSYEAVKEDTNVAKAKLADNGFIVFNDYIMFDHLNGMPYGVVQAVNELIVSEDWRVCGFSLEKNMFCDIAIRKQSGPRL